MKRFFIFLIAAILAVGVMAENHMKFKGVEIDGTPQETESKRLYIYGQREWLRYVIGRLCWI